MDDTFKILVVDDEMSYCEALTLTLKNEGYRVTGCVDPTKAVDIIKKENIDLMISDLKMPKKNGIELLREAKAAKPGIYIIILTAYGTINNAVEAMKYGAFNYIIKGTDIEQLLDSVRKITRITQNLGTAEFKNYSFEYDLQSHNEKFKNILNLAEKAAKSDSNILILGESGVGKEVIAQYIYLKSKRSRNKFVATNCHTYSGTLLESELFGHEKGAFTGALQKRTGLFEDAGKGTLFLDEIGDISLDTQGKLLRALETKTIKRIGSNDDIKVDFRLIAATNKNLRNEIENGKFREDLFFRISTIALQIPPLRERKEDLPGLIEYLINATCKSLGTEIIEFPTDVINRMLEYDYPGNVRELKNIIERLIVLSEKGVIKFDVLNEMFSEIPVENQDSFQKTQLSLKEMRQHMEAKYIKTIYFENDYDMDKTSKILGISKRQLYNKLSEYGLTAAEIKNEREGH